MNLNCEQQFDAGIDLRKDDRVERKLEVIDEQSAPLKAARRLLEIARQTGGSFSKMTLAESQQIINLADRRLFEISDRG